MKEFLYWCVGLIATVHDHIMDLNNAYEANFTDKEMHFLVIGLLGMAMIFVVYPLFKYLAKHHHEMVIAWIYVFTLIIVIIEVLLSIRLYRMLTASPVTAKK